MNEWINQSIEITSIPLHSPIFRPIWSVIFALRRSMLDTETIRQRFGGPTRSYLGSNVDFVCFSFRWFLFFLNNIQSVESINQSSQSSQSSQSTISLACVSEWGGSVESANASGSVWSYKQHHRQKILFIGCRSFRLKVEWPLFMIKWPSSPTDHPSSPTEFPSSPTDHPSWSTDFPSCPTDPPSWSTDPRRACLQFRYSAARKKNCTNKLLPTRTFRVGLIGHPVSGRTYVCGTFLERTTNEAVRVSSDIYMSVNIYGFNVRHWSFY